MHHSLQVDIQVLLQVSNRKGVKSRDEVFRYRPEADEIQFAEGQLEQ